MNKVANKVNGFKEKLLYEISTGVYRRDDKLPSERQMGDKYGICRSTVRQALRELIVGGVLQAESRRGIFVTHSALDIIGQDVVEKQLSVIFMMPPLQVSNPLLQTIFRTCVQFVDPAVKMTTIFEDELTPELVETLAGDVVIFFGEENERLLQRLSRRIRSLILLNTASLNFNYLTPDNYLGGKLMAEYLLTCGHRYLGGIRYRGAESDSDFAQRSFGCYDVLEEAGIAPVMSFVQPENFFQVSAPCREALDQLLANQPRLSAIFCPSDMVAIGLYAALRHRSLRVGDDIGVIAFDDQFYAQYTAPRLTTVKYPAEAMGIRLAEELHTILKEGNCSIQENIPPVLIKRESVKDLNIPKN